MNYRADLHIHSPFSRATSPDSSPAGLAAWARIKGIQVVGTGDCTHPGWYALLKEQLEPAEPGLFRLRESVPLPSVLPGATVTGDTVRFLLSAEISSIYKRGGATRKVHNLLYLPDFESVERLNARLAGIGNIEADGRPILGLDSRDLLEIMLDCAPEAFLVPAHIWTPWFSLFGSRSGFDSVEECFGDLSDQIFALETGLSSDPDMNRLISALDRFALISNSDCHSPAKLGREVNLFSTGLDFFSLRNALRKNHRDLFAGTVEFYPEEGKYHFDGHRDCRVCLDPLETRRLNGLCPVCGKSVTVGVHHRVLELADRQTPRYPADAPGFHSLIPLTELLAELLQVGPASKQVMQQYGRAVSRFGSEFAVLLEADRSALADHEPLLAEAIHRMRAGKVIRSPGYDGEFGRIRVFGEGELTSLAGQGGLFADQPAKRRMRAAYAPGVPSVASVPDGMALKQKPPSSPNAEQQAVLAAEGQRILVAAGPGTGKTFTLVSRLQRLLEQGADPGRIVAITFTNRAADEMRERLRRCCGSIADRLFVGTFHRFCLEQLRADNPGLAIVGPESRQRLLKRLFPGIGAAERARIADDIQIRCSGLQTGPASDDTQRYVDELVRLNALDLDAVIPVCVQLYQADGAFSERLRQRVGHLFVDEFQDINRAQYDLIELLAVTATVFAIGDPDQAIYGFRGGDLRHFFRFAEMPGTVLLPLRITYRLPNTIVRAAGSLISRNLICSGLPLQAATGCGQGAIEFHRALSPAAEAELVVTRIEQLVGGVDSFSRHSRRSRDDMPSLNLSFADIAILFRLGRQAEELAEALARRGIPYQLVGATPYYLNPSLRPVYHLVQVAGGADEIALWLALLGELKGVGAATLERLETALPLQGDFIGLAAPLVTSSAAAGALRDLGRMVERMQRTAAESGLARALEEALPCFDPAATGDDAARLVRLAEGFGRDLAAFSCHLRDYAAATVYDRRAEAVALMSCHSSKGLEFPIVFMVGLEEGLFPCTLMGGHDIEEERRLFYVALTRAKQRAVLSASAYRSWSGPGVRERSRFVEELPTDLLELPDPAVFRRSHRRDDAVQMELF